MIQLDVKLQKFIKLRIMCYSKKKYATSRKVTSQTAIAPPEAQGLCKQKKESGLIIVHSDGVLTACDLVSAIVELGLLCVKH